MLTFFFLKYSDMAGSLVCEVDMLEGLRSCRSFLWTAARWSGPQSGFSFFLARRVQIPEKPACRVISGIERKDLLVV